MIVNKNQTGFNKIRFDGGYFLCEKNSSMVSSPVYFFNNNLSHYSFGTASSVEDFEGAMYKYLTKKDAWGAFEIVGDTIKVTTYYRYFGQPSYDLETNFQGIIKNKDTITNWHMIAPYPKLPKLRREDYKSLFMMNETLTFKQMDSKPFMDSISDKVVFRGVLH